MNKVSNENKLLILDSLEVFLENNSFKKEFYYIAHLLDRVLLGEEKDNNYDTLEKAINNGQILELHLFNEEKEYFASRVDGQLIVYETLEHKAGNGKNPVITRKYELIPNLLKANGVDKYKYLEVKEYIEHDKNNYMAYVEKTVLYRFVGGKENE